MNEELADRVLRILVSVVPFLVFLFIFAFPRGIRITLGRRALWLAPPAIPPYSYFRLAAQYQKASADAGNALAKMRDIHAECDRMLAYLLEDYPELATTGRFEVSGDSGTQVLAGLLAGVNTNDRLHVKAFQEHADDVDALLAKPIPREIPKLLLQSFDMAAYIRLAFLATEMRVSVFDEDLLTIKLVLQPLKEQAALLDSRQKVIDEISAGLQTLGDQVDEIDDEVAQVTQSGRRRPGRPAGRDWSDDEIVALHAAYQARGEQTSIAFAKSNNLSEGQMFKLFRRVGISKKGGGEFGQ